MKKNIFIAGVFVCTVCTVLFSGVGVLFAAEIIHVEGKVQIQGFSQKQWRSAEVGMEVGDGDQIRTARRSRAEIALDEAQKNFLTVEENTIVILNSIARGEIDAIDLKKGQLYANVETVMAGLTFEVSTPSAVAGVRGTGWSVETAKKQDEIVVYESNVFVQAFDEKGNLLEEIMVPQGFKTIVERFKGPGDLIETTRSEREMWGDVKEDFQGRGKKEDKKKQGEDQPDRLLPDSTTGQMDEISQLMEDKMEIIENVQQHIEEINVPTGSEDHHSISPPNFDE